LDTTIFDLFGNHLASAYQADFSLRLVTPSGPAATVLPGKDLAPYAGGVLPHSIDPTDPAARAMLQTLTQRTDGSTPSQGTDRAPSPFSADAARSSLASSVTASELRNSGLIQTDGRTALGALPGSRMDRSV